MITALERILRLGILITLIFSFFSCLGFDFARTMFNGLGISVPFGYIDSSGNLSQTNSGSQSVSEPVYPWSLSVSEPTDAKEQNELGENYYFGKNNIQQDYEKAEYWYRKAANQGLAAAQFNLGLCYENGYGVRQDYRDAIYWYQKALDQGYQYAQNCLRVLQNTQSTSEPTDAEEQYLLGLQYYSEKNYKEAVRLFRKASNQGYAEAQSSLGICYNNGEGVDQNFEKAVYWYKKAAQEGEATAQYNLGWCYENGIGITQNYNKAISWYKKAAKQGQSYAQERLRELTNKEETASSESTNTQNEEPTDALSLNNLGIQYYRGDGVTQDYKKAVSCFRKAANQGYAESQFYLGYCYHFGNGIDQDYERAVYWYERAADQGIANAQYMLGEYFIFTNNFSQAFHWYQKAAAQGFSPAQNALGQCYEKGLGVERSAEWAEYWYQKANENR